MLTENITDIGIKVQSFMDTYAPVSKDLATTVALCGAVGGLMIGCAKDMQELNTYDPQTAEMMVAGSAFGMATLLISGAIEIPVRYFTR